jgi:GT2 family glycosyltransferase
LFLRRKGPRVPVQTAKLVPNRQSGHEARTVEDDSISVVIVNWNGQHLLDACLASLQRQSRPPTEVILVDNGSTDESVAFVQSRYLAVRVIRLSSNRGFAAGCNTALRVATGALIATLNNDAVADERWLESLAKRLQGRRDVGMVASKMLRHDTPTFIDSTGICLDSTAVAWDRRVGEAADSANRPAEIFGPCAGAAMYRRELFADIGEFDEDFFMYLEDVDLAWRARLAGWRCLYAPDAIVYHWHSATAVENSPFKLFHLARNRVWTIAKNYPAPDLYLHLPAIVLFDVAAVLSSLIQPRPGLVGAERLVSLRGRLRGLISLGTALKKRNAVHRRQRVPNWRVANELEPIVWLGNPFGFRSLLERRAIGQVPAPTQPVDGPARLAHNAVPAPTLAPLATSGVSRGLEDLP